MKSTVRAICGAAIYRWHLEGRRYVYVNPEITGITGFLAEDLERTGREQLMARIHPEDRARVEAEVEAVLAGGRTTVFYRFLRRDGTYRTLMEHLYGASEGEGLTFLAGMVEDVTDELAVAAAATPVACRGGGSVTGKVAVGVAVAAVLALTLQTGYLIGLRQAAWSPAGTALPATAPGEAQVVSRAAEPGTAARARATKATKRARITEARAASPQHRHQIVHNHATARPAVQRDVTAPQAVTASAPRSLALPEPEAATLSREPAAAPPPPAVPSEEEASPSFWSWVAHLPPQPIAPDPPSYH